jgi:hypothetical protein
MEPKDQAGYHFEDKVRRMSSLIWGREASSRLVNGVQIDCVLEQEDDYWICVEVSVSDTLQKLREDLAKFGVVRPYLLAQNIGCKSFFVTEQEPSNLLVETARGMRVTALSFDVFSRQFINFPAYRSLRMVKPFGSAVDPRTGETAKADYVPVKYVHDGKEVVIDELVAMLATGKRLVLLGEVGTGKSRCFSELFARLAEHSGATMRYPVAINLREHWGALRAHEIL